MSYLLDASALLAVLLNEPGGELVTDLLGGAEISVVNLSEVCAILMDYGHSRGIVEGIMAPLTLHVRTFGEAQAWKAAELRPSTKRLGLSLGDRACIAQAMLTQLPILTADRRMAEAGPELSVDIRMIR